jgi:hypothetical protein
MTELRTRRGNEPLSPIEKRAIKAMREAHMDAVKENARWGLPMIYWKDGKVVEVSAKGILAKMKRKKAAAAKGRKKVAK